MLNRRSHIGKPARVFVFVGSVALAGIGANAARHAIAEESSAEAAADATQEQAVRRPSVMRSWGPEQATGEPNTMMAGDIVTAWASATPDAQVEWLQLDYEEAIQPKAVIIHETYNPGAVNKVSAFDADGEEHEVWAGVDPTPRSSAKGISVIPVKLKFKTNRVKIYIDSPAVEGWNEIDAVGLRDADGTTHWAAFAEASTTYAQRVEPTRRVVISVEQMQRFDRLEEEVASLRKEIDELKQLVRQAIGDRDESN